MHFFNRLISLPLLSIQFSTSMKIYTYLFLFLLGLWMLPPAVAQTLPIRLTITVTPPYPVSVSYYAEHPQQVVVQISNQSRETQTIRLIGSINGLDNNVKVVAKNRGASEILTLNSGESRLLAQTEVQDLFDARKLTFTGISYRRTQIDDGLPEGLYNVCVYAVDAVRTALVKSEETCSNAFSVTNLEPPMIIAPLADVQIQEMPVQNVLFTWTLPAMAPATTEYTLRMVEVVGNMNPNNAMQAATTPVFFERTVQVNTLLYGPADPPLIPGRKYAFMVTAKDPMEKAVFRNGGRSEVRVFTYVPLANPVQSAVAADQSRIRLISPSDLIAKAGKVPVMEVNKQKPFGVLWFPDSQYVVVDSSQVYYETFTYQQDGVTKTSQIRKGSDNLIIQQDLVYRMQIRQADTDVFILQSEGKNQFSYAAVTPPAAMKNGGFYTVQVYGIDSVTNKQVAQSDRVKFQYKIIPENASQWPVQIKMKLTYQYDTDTEVYPYQGSATIRRFYAVVDTTTQGKTGSRVVKGMIPVQQINPGESAAALQTVTSLADGQVQFSFQDKITLPYPKGLLSAGELKGTSETHLVIKPQYLVEVNSPYFQPLKDTFLLSGPSVDRGLVTLTPYSYRLQLQVQKGYKQGAGKNAPLKVQQALSGLKVIIYRRIDAGSLPGLPAWEGEKGSKSNNLAVAQSLLNSTNAPGNTSVFVSSQGVDAIGKPVNLADVNFGSYKNTAVNQKVSTTSSSPVQPGGKGVSPSVANTQINLAAGAQQLVPVAFDTTHLVNNAQNVAESYVTFKRLLISQQSPTDDYYVRVIDPKNKNEVLKDEKLPFSALWFINKGNTTSDGVSSKKVKPTYFEVQKRLTCEVTHPPTASLKGRLLYQYRDGVGGSRPANSVPVSLQGMLVLTTTFGTIAFTQDAKNKGVFVGSVVNQNGNMRTHTTYTFSMQDNPEVAKSKVVEAAGKIVANAHTDGNGYFDFGTFAIWDSVKTFNVTVKAFVLHENTGEKKAGPGKANATDIKGKYIDPVVNPGDYYTNNPVFNSMPEFSQKGGLYQVGTNVNSKQVQIGTSQALPGVQNSQFQQQQNLNKQQNLQKKQTKAAKNAGGPAEPEYWVDEESFNAQAETIEGKLAFTYRLVPQLVYYATVENDININPLETKDAGTVTSFVNDYTATIKVVGADGSNSDGISGALLRLKRRNQAPYTEPFFPKGETEETQNLNPKFVSDKGDANLLVLRQKSSGATTELKHLLPADYVLEVYFNDSLQNQLAAYESKQLSLGDIIADGGKIKVDKKLPVIAGRIVNKFSTKGVEKVHVTLVGFDKNKSPFPAKNAETDANGYFVFNNLDTQPVKWTFYAWLGDKGYRLDMKMDSVTKAGGNFEDGLFDQTFGQLGKGDKRFIPLQVVPDAKVWAYVISEDNKNIPALYQVASVGAIKETIDEPNCPKSATIPAASDKKPGSRTISTPFGAIHPYVFNEFEDEKTAECRQYLEALVPPGSTDTLIVIPNDLQYFPKKVVLSNIKKGETNLGNIVLKKRLHRITFVVNSISNVGGMQKIVPAPKGGTIKILQENLNWTGSGVQYTFFNIAENNFPVKYTPPAGSNLCVLDTIIINKESEEFVTVTLRVKTGRQVTGMVTLNGKPLPNAKVTFDDGAGESVAATLSDNQGKYVLNGMLPELKSILLIATPPDNLPTVAGMSIAVLSTEQKVNFDLKETPFNLTRLVGYPVKIESFMQSGNKYKVRGTLDMAKMSNLYGSNLKAFDETVRVPFVDVEVKAGGKKDSQGKPYAVPADLSFKLGASPRLVLDNKYTLKLSGVMTPAPVIGRKQGNDYAGYISSRVQLVNNSFDMPGSYFKFESDQFYIAQKSGNSWQTNLLFMPTQENMYDGVNPPALNTAFNFSNNSGGAIKFSLLEFKGVSSPEDSRYENGAIVLQKPTVTADHVKTLNKQPLSFVIPPVSITEKSISEVIAQPGKPLLVPLEDWNLEIRNWTFSKEEGGFYSHELKNNTIKTNFASLNFQTFRLRNDIDHLFIDQVDFKKIRVADAVDLNVNPDKTETVFGIDEKTGADLQPHYVLKFVSKDASPVASIAGDLLGFGDKKLNFQAITLISSNQTTSLIELMPNTPAVLVDKVLDFQPNGFMSSATDFTVTGTYQFNIPRLQDMEGAFRFSKDKNGGGKPARQMQFDKEINFNIGKGNVVFNATQPLDLRQDSLRIFGTASEEAEEFSIPVILRKRSNGTIEIAQEKTIKAPGNPNLDIRSGFANVVNNDWDYLRFLGVSTGGNLSEMKGQPLPFTVYGDLTCEGGAVKLTSIETPLGNMNLVFDYKTPRMMGSLDIINPGLDLGAARFKGSAEMMLEKPGFYITVSGTVSFGVPIVSPLSAGVLIGKHSAVPQDVIAKTEQFNYHKGGFCNATNNLTGIYLCGRKDIIEPSNSGFSLGPVAVRFGYQVGADASLLLNFTPSPGNPRFQMMMGVFGKGYLEMSAITCTSLDFNGEVNLIARLGLSDQGFSLGSLNASVLSTINLKGKLEQKIPVPSLTEGISCEGSLFSFDKGVDVYSLLEVKDGSPNFEFALKPKNATTPCTLPEQQGGKPASGK
jgi:TANFOR domain-containing protein